MSLVYEVDKTSGGAVTRTVTYYPVAGAMRINSTLYYTLKDHLGSASVVTDASGNVLGEQRYYPFGETRLTTGTIFTDRLFTGQREMAGLGIYHYQARFYSPKLGRFLSADTIVPGYANPQNLNRYSYVINNPLLYVDPTGHDADYFCSGSNDYSSSCTGYVQDQGTLGSSMGGGNGGGGGDDDEPPPGHDYPAGPNPVCLDWSWINCTEAEVEGYLTQFQYPGQWPWNPVTDLGSYNVAPAEFWGIPTHLCYIGMCDSGAIWVDIDDNNPLTLTNRTERSHIFNVGDVVRKGMQDANGNWYVTTRGKGTNGGYGIFPGPFLDGVNQNIGPIAFEVMDMQMVLYTTVVETGQYISSLLP